MQRLTIKLLSVKSVTMLVIGFVALLMSVVIWPHIDLTVSSWFYAPGQGFFLTGFPVFTALQWLAYYGSRILGGFFLLAFLITAFQRKDMFKINSKGWLFLFLGILLAPALVGNYMFKDHWGRARPREVTEFGGHTPFSPALIPQDLTHTNGSFVSGDASFGFYLPSIAYIVPRRSSRKFFWGGLGVGSLFALARIIIGAHFLSDTLFAALLMLLCTAILHAVMYGRASTLQYWRDWLLRNES